MSRSKRARSAPKGAVSSPPRPVDDFPPKYKKLINRFYEPLILLRVLGQTRGGHSTVQEHDTRSLQCTRRRFLACLAYVASNAKRKKISEFLAKLLERLRVIATSTADGDGEDEIATKCIDFATPRIKKEVGLLRSRIAQYHKRSAARATEQDMMLLGWLGYFQNPEALVSICQFAYDERRSTWMKELEQRSRSPRYKSSDDASHVMFNYIRHYVGRLADHIRKPKHLIQHCQQLIFLFDNWTVKGVEAMQATPRPEHSPQTSLPNILKRMLPKDDPKLPEYEGALTVMDRGHHISDGLREYWSDPTFQPKVHAEIQILEQFYNNGLAFEDNDPYIACSKPACFCCHLYFRHHPLKCVEADSHQKVYHNWGPPMINTKDEKEFMRQRDILNEMVKDIRNDALNQIIQRRGSLAWHADSVTGITESVLAEREQADELDSVDGSAPSYNPDSDELFDMPEIDSEAVSFCSDADDPESDSDGGVALDITELSVSQ
ncbi:hypothetical protein NA57DRAFT_55743 [Rhizodiscina lignyota]|uniref:Uncharacterized protein n=1 Tax=Rhizodiscina lignyota TaxID=1504668 RepID=A0A9P4IDE8_9PEZI|nr:hypothetical protein NA57DRAFT_55743 [Rhizodiscina lignyota]